MKSLKSFFEKKFKSDFRENEGLAKYTTLNIGGKSKYFLVVRNVEDLIWSVRKAQEHKCPYFILGGGSNVLVADSGFEGLTIKNEAANLIYQSNLVVCDSGMQISVMLKKLAEANLGGLEFLAGIPGTIGGAVCGNAGAWGKTIKDVVFNVLVLGTDGKVKKFSNKEIGFVYRGSFLKQAIIKEDNFPPVVLSVQLKTSPNTKEGILRIISNYIKMRQQKQPSGFSAGSTFKNITETDNLSKENKIYVMDDVIPAGLLLDKLGFRGRKKGKLQVSDIHANFIINNGRGCSADYAEFVDEMHSACKKILGFELEKEIVYVGNPYEKKKSFLNIFQKNNDLSKGE